VKTFPENFIVFQHNANGPNGIKQHQQKLNQAKKIHARLLNNEPTSQLILLKNKK